MDTNTLPANFYSGLSGLQLPVPKYLYPLQHRDASRLTYYSTFFNSIEINSTFYKLPMASTITKWLSLVPDNFKFTFKLWKEITHVKELDFKKTDVDQFFKIVSAAANKKGCILIQFPPSLGKTHFTKLKALLKYIQQINSKKEWRIVVEFRNKSWYDKDIYAFLESQNVTLVLHDIPKSASPMITHTLDTIYARFHGPTGNYRESYQDHFLSEYATFIKEWLEEGKTVFAYFNNTMGDAFKNLETLNGHCIDC